MTRMDQIQNGASEVADSRKRRRSRKACIPCSFRKRKCDGKQPCTSCDGFGYVCTYAWDSANKPAAKRRKRSASPQSHSDDDNEPPKDFFQSTVRVKEDHGLLEPYKNRYMGQHAAVAFVRCLAKDLQFDNPPRLHSFGWNVGLRPEPSSRIRESAPEFVSLNDIKTYARVFFEICHPLVEFLDFDRFVQRATDHWTGTSQSLTFEALACTIFSLGSLFSSLTPHPQESRALAHAESILMDPPSLRMPNFDSVSAMTCLGIYVRATTKPQACWIIVSQALHMAEAMGLHKDIEQASKAAEIVHSIPQSEMTSRAQLFWILTTMNRIISYELGRSPIIVENVTCKNPYSSPTTSPAAAFVELGSVLRRSEEGLSALTFEERCYRIKECLRSLAKLPSDYPILTASIADISFCIYRRSKIADQMISKDQLKQVVELGKNAMKAIGTLLDLSQPWWQILNTPFQFLCICISIDSPESSAEIPNILSTLELVVNKYNTHLATEALDTARLLVHALRDKKRRELALLEECNNIETPSSGNPLQLDNANNLLQDEEAFSLDPALDIDWSFLLDPQIG